MTALDVLIALFVVLTVLRGARTGFLAGVFSLVGVILGASLGSRVAPYLLPEGESPAFVAGITLISILAFAAFGEVVARTAGGALRERLSSPASATLDGLGGAALGLALSLVLVWAVGVFALQTPLLTGLHPAVKESHILQALKERMPSELLTRAVAELDPLPEIQGPEADVSVPNEQIAGDPDGLADGAREEHSLRLQHRGLGLGRRPGSHRHQRPRGRRCDHDQSPTRGHGTAPSRRGRLLRRQERRGDPARRQPWSQPYAARHAPGRRGGCRPRLPGERPARRPASPHRRDAARDLQRRVQPGPGGAHRHQLPRLRPARQLGWSRRQRGWRSRRYRLRQPRQLGRLRLRHPLPDNPASPGNGHRAYRTGEHRQVRELALQHAACGGFQHACFAGLSARSALLGLRLSARRLWRLVSLSARGEAEMLKARAL